jgi:Family of unknown function (DUF6011)
MENELSFERVYDYILQERAEVVFHNKKTGNHRAYCVVRKVPGIWYVYYEGDYLGFIRGDLFIVANLTDPLHKASSAFSELFRRIVNKSPHPDLVVLHTGRCSVCNRKLKDPESIEYGIGPECRKNIGLI